MQPAAALVDDLENQSQTHQAARAWYLVSRLESSLYLGTDPGVESEGLAEEALRSFAALDHHRGLARTFLARLPADWYQLHGGASVRWLTRAAATMDPARRTPRRRARRAGLAHPSTRLGPHSRDACPAGARLARFRLGWRPPDRGQRSADTGHAHRHARRPRASPSAARAVDHPLR